MAHRTKQFLLFLFLPPIAALYVVLKEYFFVPFKIKLTQFYCAEQINENKEEHNELSLYIA